MLGFEFSREKSTIQRRYMDRCRVTPSVYGIFVVQSLSDVFKAGKALYTPREMVFYFKANKIYYNYWKILH